jgi:hypothetical protein
MCRVLRLELVAALGVALASPALAWEGPQGTQTTLSTETRVQNGHTLTAFAVAVKGEDGLPAAGAVVIEEDGRQLAGAGLSGEGQARLEFGLPPGQHNLSAVYMGDAAHKASTSAVAGVRAQATTTPGFQVSVNPASLSLTAGQSGYATVSITPVNASALPAPMFVTLSCSGFPDQSSCTFTPENVEVLPTSTAAITSSMSITTQKQSLVKNEVPSRAETRPVSWAILLPGTLGLAGLAFSARRRWLSRVALVALVALVAGLGTTACAPRYNYYNHGPDRNLPTPSGSYTLKITAQSSNGISASTQSIPFSLTVN